MVGRPAARRDGGARQRLRQAGLELCEAVVEPRRVDALLETCSHMLFVCISWLKKG